MPADTPYVVAHLGVSLDGKTDGFPLDSVRFHQLVGTTWHEDVTLAGSDTVLALEPALVHGPGPRDPGPLLAVVDGRARVTRWEELRDAGHWSEVLALRCHATPPHPHGRHVPELVVGDDQVDLAAALRAIGRRPGAEVVRVASGGRLVGRLLAAGLVDEISLLVHPVMGVGSRDWWGDAPPPQRSLQVIDSDTFGGGLVWLRYRVA
ncbi:pyrimidine reductase [Herbidospora sp. NEAU-GS84]|uniref:Pyrimidine reductase n=1 Tax=Herbidospora solisilvae TaxID=2696284 RepID=A0A7C9NEU2_9ACTN|nr:dihydrofolate reductase family protein [Herbidospora solisilvae]NAS20492.1 pyrimidine reductase [Herbidospora solisilvae]